MTDSAPNASEESPAADPDTSKLQHLADKVTDYIVEANRKYNTAYEAPPELRGHILGTIAALTVIADEEDPGIGVFFRAALSDMAD